VNLIRDIAGGIEAIFLFLHGELSSSDSYQLSIWNPNNIHTRLQIQSTCGKTIEATCGYYRSLTLLMIGVIFHAKTARKKYAQMGAHTSALLRV
jgi:hypothetical protein